MSLDCFKIIRMLDQLKTIKKEFEKQLEKVSDGLGLQELEQKFFSRKSGEFSALMKNLGELKEDARKEFGRVANEVKTELEQLLNKKKTILEEGQMKELEKTEWIDITQPSVQKKSVGHLHPNTQIQDSLEDLFASMGFMVWDGPELESDYYNLPRSIFPKIIRRATCKIPFISKVIQTG